MSMIINKADARKTVRDASADMAKSGGDVAPVARKTAHDASQPSGEAVRKVVEATSRDGIRKNAEAAEQSLQKAADDLRGTIARSTESAGNVADVTRQVSGRAVEQLGQVSALQEKAFKDVTGRTQQNLGVMMQTGIKLAGGYQSIMREVGRLHAECRAVPYRWPEQHHARPVPAGLHGGAEQSAERRSASHAEQQRQDLRGDGPCRQGCGPEHR